MTEAQLHKSIVEWLALQFPQETTSIMRHQVVWTTFPAGGGGAARGGVLQRQGLQPGWPDIVLLMRGQFIGLELKSKKGTLSAAQNERHEQIRHVGGYVYVVRSLDEAIAYITRINDAMQCQFPEGIRHANG